jgi:predicted hydrocarbon binding protein
MLCAACGTSIPNESRFCLHCGAALVEGVSEDSTLPPSALFHYNKFGMWYLSQLKTVLGESDFQLVCQNAGVLEWQSQLPPANFVRAFPFAHIYAFEQATAQVLGKDAAYSVHQQCGQAIFRDMLIDFGRLARLYALFMRGFAPLTRASNILSMLSQTFDRASDQASHSERHGNRVEYTITACPECAGGNHNHRGCAISHGMISEAVQWIAPERRWHITEVTCGGRGDVACVFSIEVQTEAVR